MEEAMLCGAVLCGGRSTRMGADKAALRVDGETLLARAVRRLRAVAEPVLVASGRSPVEGYWCVLDERPDWGPLAGIVAALRASPRELVGVVAVDMPGFDRALLLRLASLAGGHDVVVPRSERGLEPLHAVYRRGASGRLRAAASNGEVALRHLVACLDALVVDAAELGAAPGFARNLNSPEDITAWAASRQGGEPLPG